MGTRSVDMNKVRPIRDTILVQPEMLEETTPGGIVIPNNARMKTQLGKVLRVGPGRVTEHGQRVEPEVKPGDRILYLENSIAQRLTSLAREGEPLVMPECDIIAVIDP